MASLFGAASVTATGLTAAAVTVKETGAARSMTSNVIDLDAPSVVKLMASPRDITKYSREGNDLIVHFRSGKTIRITNFYKVKDGEDSDLVLEDENGHVWHGQHSDGLADFRYAEIESVDQLTAGAGGGSSHLCCFSVSAVWLWVGSPPPAVAPQTLMGAVAARRTQPHHPLQPTWKSVKMAKR
ncbi:BapA prefix-like domain-containing protein [Ensifer adhaerens]|uniref:BapA/Bap/LapF family prefix-like domain-containing protein n=1 Tax=Ensifer adhaerens TaxID=106592 RepID=UPI00384DC8CF